MLTPEFVREAEAHNVRVFSVNDGLTPRGAQCDHEGAVCAQIQIILVKAAKPARVYLAGFRKAMGSSTVMGTASHRYMEGRRKMV